MTNERAISLLMNISAYDIDNKRGMQKREALDLAIKALEQEFVLDKIRAEIELHRRKTESIDQYDLVGDCLDIIDKYKTESEE